MKKLNRLILAMAIVLPISTMAVSIDGTVDAEVGAGSNTSSTQVNTSVDAEVRAGTNMEVDTSDTMEVDTTMSTDSEADISASVQAKHKDVAKAEVRDNEVEVRYKHRGRLFGIFPVTYTTKTVVKSDTDGSADVDTSSSWWSIFVTGKNDIESRIETAVRDSSSISGSVSTSANASTKAQAAESIAAMIEAEVASQVDVTTE